MAKATKERSRVTGIGGEAPTNGAQPDIEMATPYRAIVEVEGVAPILFHRWNCEAVDEKSRAPKGSKAKKTDNIESYVYRNSDGELCIPGEYIRRACVETGRSMQDPRSPRKSAKDLFNAVIFSLTELASLGATDWDYEDKRRVVVQRNAITRVRPAMREGWRAQFIMLVTEPGYVPPMLLQQIVAQAGRLSGLGDFRPTYGRYAVTRFEVIEE